MGEFLVAFRASQNPSRHFKNLLCLLEGEEARAWDVYGNTPPFFEQYKKRCNY
jgi:hypothetical protein